MPAHYPRRSTSTPAISLGANALRRTPRICFQSILAFAQPSIRGAAALSAAGLFVFSGSAQAATRIKQANTTTIDLAGSWDTLPGTGDIGLWDATATTGTTVGIGAGLSLGAIQVTTAPANVSITTGSGALTLNGVTVNGISNVGIDLSNTVRNLSIAAPITLGANQNWLIGSGRTLTLTGGVNGSGVGMTIQGLGVVAVTTAASNFSGTLTLNGSQFQETLNSTFPNNLLSGNPSLALSSGHLTISTASTGGTQSFASTSIGQGFSRIRNARTSGSNPLITLGALTRTGVGAVVNVEPGSNNPTNSNISTTSGAAGTGFIGGWALFSTNKSGTGAADPTGFAKGSTTGAATNISAVAANAMTWSAGSNTQINSATVLNVANGVNTQTVQFDTAVAGTITLAGTSQITGGGILVTSAVGSNNQLIQGGTLTGATNGDLVVYQNSGTATLTINSAIADATSTALTKAGTGALILGGNNTFTGGVYINAGEVRLNNAGALNSTAPNAVTFTNGNALNILSQTLSLNGNSVTISGLNTSAVVGTGTAVPTVQNISAGTAATLTINNASAGTFAGTIQNGTGSAALGLTKTGAGIQNLTGSLTYTGATAVNGGTLKLSANNNLNASSGISVGASGILDLTAVPGGQSIASGKTLSGSGSILGSVALASGSTTTPGGVATVGNLSIGTLSLNSGSTTNFEFGTGNDKFTISTALTIGTFSSGGFNLFTTGGAQLTTTGIAYTLFDYTGATLSGFGNLNSSLILNPVSGVSYTFDNTGSAITLTLTGASGTNANWIEDTGTGNWSTPANWSGGIVPTNALETANFFVTTPNNPAHTVNLDGNRTVGAVNFDNTASSYTISGGSTLTLDNGGGSASISNANGNHTVAVPITLASSNTNLGVAKTNDVLSISGPISNTAGTPGITKVGDGTVVLSGANTYTGTTTVSLGTLRFANKTALYNNVTSNWTDAKIIVSAGGIAAFNVGGAGEFTAADIQALAALGTATGGFKNGSFIGLDTTNAGGSFTYGNVLADPNAGANALGVAKLGTGALVLDQANTYSGGTILKAGALHINHDTAIGTGRLTINAGTLDNTSGAPRTLTNNNVQTWNGDFTFAGSNDLNLGTGAVTLGANTVVTVSAGTLTEGGALSGGFSVAKSGPGALILSGASTHSGGTILNAGTLHLNNNTAVGTGPITINGGTLDNTSGTTRTLTNNNAQTWNGDFTFTGSNDLNMGTGAVTLGNSVTTTVSAGNLTVGGAISGGFNLGKSGNGKLILTGANTYTGTTTVNGGILQIGSGGATGSLPNGQINLNNSSSLIYNSTSATQVVSSLITGTGSVTVRAGATPGVVFTNAANSFSGGVTLEAGAFLSLPATTTPGTYFGTGTLTLAGGNLRGSASGNNNKTFAQNIAITTATNTINLGGSTVLTLTGNVSGNGTLTRTGGTGALIFSGADNSGFTGTYSAGTGTSSTSWPVTFTTAGSGSAAATWDFSSNIGGTRTITLADLAGGTINFGSLNGIMTNGGGNTITNTVSAATMSVGGTGVDSTYGGTIAGLAGPNGISLAKVGGAKLTLTAANTYSGSTTVTAGTLVNGITNALPAATALTVNTTGTVDLASFHQTVGSLAGDSTGKVKNSVVATTSTFTVNPSSGSTTFAGVIAGTNTGAQGDINLLKSGAGRQVLTGNNTFSGSTTITGGTLEVANDGTTSLGQLSSTNAIVVNNGGTLLLSGAGANSRITSAAGITLGGTGTGTIAVAGGAQQGSAATVVPNVSPSGTNMLGLGSLTLSSGSTLDFDSASNGNLLVFTSFIPGAFTLDVTNWTNATFALGTSGISSDDRLVFNQDLQTAGLLGSINFGGGLVTTQVDLGGGFYEIGGLTAVPEPTTILGGLALLGLVGYRERRRLSALRTHLLTR